MSRFRILAFSVLMVFAAVLPVQGAPPRAPEVTALVFTPDGKTLISSSLDGNIVFRDPVTGQQRFKVEAHQHGVYALALSADGKWLASAGGDGLVRLWDVAKVKEIRTFQGHDKEVAAVAISPDGRTLASGGYDHTVRLWDVATGKPRHTLQGHEHKVTAVAFAPDGQTLASGGMVPAETAGFRGSTQADQVRLWDVATGKAVRQLPQRGHRLAFSPDGQTLVTAGMYLSFQAAGNQGGIVIGGFTLDGGSRIVVWDLARQKERFKLDEYWTGLALSADGKYLASGWGSRLHMGGIVVKGSNAKGVHLWELATGREVLRLPVPEGQATVMAISPDGRRLAAGHGDGTLKLWDLAPKGWKAEPNGSPPARDLDQAWNALAQADAAQAYRAVWTLSADADQAVAFIKERLSTARTEALVPVPQLIADLDSNDFAVREKASKALQQLGTAAEPALVEALKGQPSAEAKKRINALLEALARNALPPEQLRWHRAIQVLERIGSSGAREILERLAKAMPADGTARDAKAALDRLARRPPAAPQLK